MTLEKDEKKQIILGLIYKHFHMDISEGNDDELAELILKVIE